MKILAVDGDHNTLALLGKYLTERSPEMEVVPFTNSLGAIQYMVRNKKEVAAAFVALVMKRINGIDFMHCLNNMGTGVPIFVMAETDTWELRELARMGGASGFLVKPLTPRSVAAVMEEALYGIPL